jgi:hypothetical protein
MRTAIGTVAGVLVAFQLIGAYLDRVDPVLADEPARRQPLPFRQAETAVTASARWPSTRWATCASSTESAPPEKAVRRELSCISRACSRWS